MLLRDSLDTSRKLVYSLYQLMVAGDGAAGKCMEREILRNKIIREIIARIASGAVGVGDRLPSERALCGEFGVSRGTVREALIQLEKLRVIQIRPNSGAYVRRSSVDAVPSRFLPESYRSVSLDDVVDARLAIEVAAARAACRNRTESDIDVLQTLVRRMEAAIDDLPSFLDFDMQFHQALIRASHNPVLEAAFTAIYEYHRYSSVFTSRQEGEEDLALGFHERIVALVETQFAGECAVVLSEHLEYLRKYADVGAPAGETRSKKEGDQ